VFAGAEIGAKSGAQQKKRMCPEPLAPNKSAVQKYSHAEFISAPNRTTKIPKRVRNDAQSAHQGTHPAKQGAARARSNAQ